MWYDRDMKAHGPTDIYRHLTGQPGFDYDQIMDTVFIGTNMCCQFGFSRELLAKGVRADISLESDRTDAPDGVDFFLWLPTDDGTAPEPNELQVGVSFISLLNAQKIKMYVHCKNGHGRAPTLVAAYLISTGMDVQQAVDTIAAKRPVIHLNDAQMQALHAYRQRINHQ